MGTDALLALALAALNNAATLSNIFQLAKAEGRTTLTPAELETVRAAAYSANAKLLEEINAAP